MDILETRHKPSLEKSPDLDQVVCECYQVRESQILSAIQDGADSVESVSMLTLAGTGCGACRCRVQRLVMGLPLQCGPCGFCSACRCIKSLCQCGLATRTD